MAETLGSLIDKLSVMNLKIWHQEEIKHRSSLDDATIADAARKIGVLNKQRNDLIQEIDEMMLAISKGKVPRIYYQVKMY